MTLSGQLFDLARGMGQATLEELGLIEASARLAAVPDGRGYDEDERVPEDRKERPGNTSTWEAEQERKGKDHDNHGRTAGSAGGHAASR